MLLCCGGVLYIRVYIAFFPSLGRVYSSYNSSEVILFSMVTFNGCLTGFPITIDDECYPPKGQAWFFSW